MLRVAVQIRVSMRMRPDQTWRVGCHTAVLAGHRAEHQGASGQQSEEEADLPEPPGLEAGLSLVAEPEPAGIDIALMPSRLPIGTLATIANVTQNSTSTSNPWPRPFRPSAIAGARNRPAPIQPTPIQMIGAWICTSRGKSNSWNSCKFNP